MFTEKELDSEKWKDIDGYDGMYQVSDLGRVRSRYSGEWRVLSPRMDSNGYLFIGLRKGGKRKECRVHRLVAQAFIPNDDESKNQVNHIDESKQNNRVSNLEYCTAQYNMTYNNLHHRRRRRTKQTDFKYLYDPNLTYKQNLEVFRANGVNCSIVTLWKLRKDLGLVKHKAN